MLLTSRGGSLRKLGFLHSANDRLYPISVDMESKLPVAEMITTGIFVLDVGIKGTPKHLGIEKQIGGICSLP